MAGILKNLTFFHLTNKADIATKTVRSLRNVAIKKREKMIISTTDSIKNSKTTNYPGVVSGTDIYIVGGLFGGGLANQKKLYTSALNNATKVYRKIWKAIL